MKLTWFGHSAFRIESGDSVILIDPFLSGNGFFKGNWRDAAAGATHVLLTHGHIDHVGDSLDILMNSKATLVANFELCNFLVGKGASKDRINPGNHGGTVDCGDFTTTFVNALHSSSFPNDDGTNVYLGNPAGLVLHFANDKTVYHMGDTDIFGDMALINELHQPQVGLVPIGDRFTMGGAVAALACQRFFDFETVIPCHYGTFPVLDQNADKFVTAMDGGKKQTKVTVPAIGEALDL